MCVIREGAEKRKEKEESERMNGHKGNLFLSLSHARESENEPRQFTIISEYMYM
jgi:hypothetical protein